MELGIRPKGNYLHKASWEELYVLTEHWKSEMDFFKDEIHFLSDLIQNYLLIISKDNGSNNIASLSYNLYNLKRETYEIFKKIKTHMNQLEELIENPYSHDEQNSRDQHEEMEKQITTYEKHSREFKKDVFAMSKQAIKNRKIKQLLTA